MGLTSKKSMYSLSGLIVSAIASVNAFAASESPQSFTYQGQLTNAAGTAPLADVVSLKIGIYSKNDDCLLYEETQSTDTTSTSGLFSIQVGSGTRTVGVDPGFSLAKVFANTGTVLRAAATSNCAPGYTPTAGDARYLRFTITPQSTGIPATLSPDQILASVPQAVVAETLQGNGPDYFLHVNATANLGQASLETLTNNLDASSLHNHDSLYVKLGGATSSQSIGGVTINPSPSATSLLVKGATGQTTSIFNVVNASGTPYFTIDKNGNASMGTGDTFGLGTFVSSPTGLAAGDAGKIWYEGGSIKYWDGTGVTTLAASTGASYLSLGGGTLTGALSGTSISTTGNVSVGGNLAVTGTSTLTGNTSVAGTLSATGNTSLGGTLAVTGASTLTGNTTVGGTFGVTGATTLTGNTTVGGTFGATGNTSLGGTLAVTGTSTLTGDTTLSGNATVAGTTTLGTAVFNKTIAAASPPPASATSSLVSLGSAIVGGSANGTYLGTNAATGYTGDFENFQVNGASKYKVDNAGYVTAVRFYGDGSNLTNIASGAVNWAVPGTIGSTTPNTAAFTTLSTSGLTALKGATSDSTAAALSVVNATGTPVMFARNDGYTGIRNTAPNAPLEVTATSGGEGIRVTRFNVAGQLISIDEDNGSTHRIHATGSKAFNIFNEDPAQSINLFLGTSGTNGIFLNSGGKVGIGTTTPVSRLHVAAAPTATPIAGLVSIGEGAFDGTTAGFFSGNTSGTEIAVNSSSTYAGNFVDFQKAGVSKFSVSNTGVITGDGSGITNIPTGSVNWAVPGTIGSTTPNTGSFTSLTATSFELDGPTSGATNSTLKNTTSNQGFTGSWTAADTYTYAQLGGNTKLAYSIYSLSLSNHLLVGNSLSVSGVFTAYGASSLNNKVQISATPTATPIAALVSIGEGGFAGAAGGFVGHISGTELGVNSSSTFAGNLLDLQSGGSSMLTVPAAAVTFTPITANRAIASNNGSAIAATDPAASYTIDFSKSNVQVVKYTATPASDVYIALKGMVSGGSYTLKVDNAATAGTPIFHFNTAGNASSDCTVTNFVPANGTTTANSRSIYSLLYSVEGGVKTCDITWITGFVSGN